MLCYPGCAVPKKLCYHIQAYSSVQAPGTEGRRFLRETFHVPSTKKGVLVDGGKSPIPMLFPGFMVKWSRPVLKDVALY